MPSLSQASSKEWKRMALSTQMKTYAIFDWIRGHAGKPIYDIEPTIKDMIDVEWIALGPDGYYVTLAGQDHLL